MPIADIGEESWISQPDSGSPTDSNPIQLVQHTENSGDFASSDANEVLDAQAGADPAPDFNIANIPNDFAADSEPSETRSAVAVPDWTLPQDGTAAVAEPSENEMTLPGDESNGLPELHINTGNAIDLGSSDQPSAGLPQEAPATAAIGNPENTLRGTPSDANMLRDPAEGETPQPLEQWAAESGQPQLQPEAQFQPEADLPSQFDAAPEPFVPGGNANQLPTGPATNPLYQPQGTASLGVPAAGMIPIDTGSANQPAAFQQPAAAATLNPNVTIDAPGERHLEGVQSPSVVIQKRAPSEVKVGQPATFVIHVQNVGSVEALDVEVHDKIPSGMRLIDASPRPYQEGSALLWQLGAMPAGDERTVTLQLVPEQEGELGSVARVSFEAAASVRTIATRPELKIIQKAPETVLIGQQLEIELEVSNPGTGEATNVVLQEDVPPGLEHPKGRQLDNALGNLAPGEVRRQVLRMRAVEAGIVQNTIRLAGDNGLSTEHTVSVQVVAPKLEIELEGPSRRFLERQATYYVHLGNVGTADATNVELSIQLDRGFTFVSTENQGQYDPSRHSVHWSLAQMPAGANGKVALTLLPVQEGEQAIMLDARADLGVVAKSERRLSVEGFSELSFSITNPGGPIELGSETTYEIKVDNSGSKADSNVRVQVLLPQGLELISSEGDAGTDGRGLVAFQPKATLSPGSEHTYKIRVRGVAPGTHIVKAVVVSDLATTPVTKEESTVVYADR